ncbi:2Fe-2S iron-sulfur cluster-binding protein [Desulfurispira natronophila]|uniref:NADH-quinone oxidoreductase subunit G n=1 Tax=Desulfurispira natronophila TaxID=682562 RepID=A0A7W7Y4Q5_9BACT|nr:2Fe-2S iron-sulfur cluster-binding protein [Desulfurispira natronophila]MBB5021762.1 NADH-quinone oxidoreductase subunit G [Desulfurispira natronophila]
MAKMVTIKVDGQSVEVEEGVNLIAALDAAGIHIPHFCYHPALGFDGNCRLCLIEVEGGRGPQIACNTPAQDGMEIYLSRESSMALRRNTLEFTLINHPLDCPICDQAGECKLQDYYMELGPYQSRMDASKKVDKGKKFDFGCNIVHDQERCVLCARCVRFLRQVTGTAELGITNRSELARVTTFPGKPVDNRYAMNIIDICPVGAMTSKDFRFKQRVWYLKTAKSVCHGCAKGCSIYVDHNQEKYKRDKVYRFRPRVNDLVNGHFICDEGRLSYRRENENRMTRATVNGIPEDTVNAIQSARSSIEGSSGNLLVVVDPNWTTEQLYSAKKLAEHYGGKINGYSANQVQVGDGDDYLIRDDKAANRRSLELLEISQDKAHFTRYLRESAVVLLLGNDILDGLSVEQADEITTLLDEKTVIAVDSHSGGASRLADITIPCASYSEYSGALVNCDGILQHIEKAVTNDNTAAPAQVTLAQLASDAWNSELQVLRQELSAKVAALAEVSWDDLPDTGVALEKKEAHV